MWMAATLNIEIRGMGKAPTGGSGRTALVVYWGCETQRSAACLAALRISSTFNYCTLYAPEHETLAVPYKPDSSLSPIASTNEVLNTPKDDSSVSLTVHLEEEVPRYMYHRRSEISFTDTPLVSHFRQPL